MAQLTINGAVQTLDLAPDTPLLWALRDSLGLTGTKYGCGAALCGACTVHVNGDAVHACQTFVGDLEGAEITTIEGLSGPVAEAVRNAWIAHDVLAVRLLPAGSDHAGGGPAERQPGPG